jgi:hypothetical protein
MAVAHLVVLVVVAGSGAWLAARMFQRRLER